MPTTKNLVWLASYPKSGNTWFRIVLSHILNAANDLHYINDIDTILGSPMVADRNWFNKAAGFDTSLLTAEEIDALRPQAYAWYAARLEKRTYIKMHDAYTYLADGSALIPFEKDFTAVYFIRNPLDVAISLAHHANCPIDWSIYMMANANFAIPLEKHRDKQLRQKLLTWSLHVESWHVLTSSCNLLVLRYEDMLQKPLETFAKGLAFLDLAVSSEQLQKTLSDTAFDKLQKYEAAFGFKEKPAIEGQFFRKGLAGDWKNVLEKRQIEQIIRDHGEQMQKFGYLDEV